jgi:hypothetical protein
MMALNAYLLEQAGGQFLGCYNPRPIRGGTKWSTHAFGAAIDWGYGERHNGPGRDITMDVVVPWLIANHAELGVQQIHDYGGGRYWQAYRGWIMRPPGSGLSDSLHIETNKDSWGKTATVASRKIVTLEVKRPAPKPARAADSKVPDLASYPGRVLKLGSSGEAVKTMQRRLRVVGFDPGSPDGKFGPRTDAQVRAYQELHAKPADGLVGPKTWAALFS